MLAMTVNPGFSGQTFIPGVLPKIRQLRQMLAAGAGATDIQVDGGIDPVTAPLVQAAGASVMVAATAIFKTGWPIAESIQLLRRSLEAPVTAGQ